MSSSYSPPLPPTMSHGDLELGGGDADDMAPAVSSYLSFDMLVDEECYCGPPPPEEEEAPAAALFHSAQQGQLLQLQAGCVGGSAGEQSLPPDAASLLISPAAAARNNSHHHRRMNQLYVRTPGSSISGGARRLVTRGAESGGGKIAFKTRSDVDVLDDGYRWRKYGKKLVKNSPNPRNYYRCSMEGCHVKKRVERARDDARFVVTTYDGVHNHGTTRPPPRRGPVSVSSSRSKGHATHAPSSSRRHSELST